MLGGRCGRPQGRRKKGAGRVPAKTEMPWIETMLAGVIGTFGMTFTMTVIHRAKWANADMIRALGSLATKRYDNALLPGLVVHFTSGILFAFPYAFILTLIAAPNTFPTAGLGLVVGLFHGIVVSFLLVAVVSDQHPVERFRGAGIEVAIAHIVGHMAYGFLVGGAIGALGIDLTP